MISLSLGDITQERVDAIVNAANPMLTSGSGVNGAIQAAAGPELLAECQSLGGCETGQAKITKGYNLPAKHVIHAVGPVWNGGDNDEERLLASAYRSSLQLALDHKLKSIAFPAISTGIYGFPGDRAAKIAVETVQLFLEDHPDMSVTFVCFSDEALMYHEMAMDLTGTCSCSCATKLS